MTRSSTQSRIARRLEEAREGLGYPSLRTFHEALVERTGESFSYTAIRNYHDDGEKGRTPPVGYLDAVSQGFGIRIEWLVRGEGEMTEEAQGPRDSIGAVEGRRWREEHTEVVESTFGTPVPTLARTIIAHEWRRLSVLASQSPATREDPAELLRKLCEAVAAPAEALGVDLSELRENDVTDYVMDVVRPVAAAWRVGLREQVSEWIEEESETQEG